MCIIYMAHTFGEFNILKPWDKCIIFTKNTIISSSFELESKECNHIISDEEARLHGYRNRINQYESGLLNCKNW